MTVPTDHAVAAAGPRTLFDKLWAPHVVTHLGGGYDLLHVDRHLLHDGAGPAALAELERRGQPVACPELTFATPDHLVSSAPDRLQAGPPARARIALRERTARHGIRNFDLDDDRQGIVHVIGPELGLSLPGMLIVCGDSHTCTHGALGALAFGIGSSEVLHVLATQTLAQARPLQMRITVAGRLPTGCTAKDLALALIARFGARTGSGHAIEYAGSAVAALDVEARLTLCNMTVELGAKTGLIAPDAHVVDWCAARIAAPLRAGLREHARTLRSDPGARFDRELHFDATALRPQVTWGTSPEHAIAIDDRVPDPAAAPDAATAAAWRAALAYQGLQAGAPLAGTPIDHVFIGSCTNARLFDLQAAAAVVAGRQVARGVTAWVVPGSRQVAKAAEAEGLDAVFRAAGFAWRAPGCARCVAMNGETVAAGERCVSTSNRNFVGRQGNGARTHLASPATAAASAIAGCIAPATGAGIAGTAGGVPA